jgi:hypothetical protein
MNDEFARGIMAPLGGAMAINHRKHAKHVSHKHETVAEKAPLKKARARRDQDEVLEADTDRIYRTEYIDEEILGEVAPSRVFEEIRFLGAYT